MKSAGSSHYDTLERRAALSDAVAGVIKTESALLFFAPLIATVFAGDVRCMRITLSIAVAR